MTTFHATALVAGTAEAPLIHLAEPVSFWGGFDAATGCITDRRHPAHGTCLTRRIVVMRAARGSSSGSSVLAEAIRRGTAPAGFVLTTRDAILTIGAEVALELYARPCPIVLVDQQQVTRILSLATLQIVCSEGRALLTATRQPA